MHFPYNEERFMKIKKGELNIIKSWKKKIIKNYI